MAIARHTPLRSTTPLQRGEPLTRTGQLHAVGQRGRRLAAGDRKARAECSALPCICGCNRSVQWAHLKRRAVESIRHADWNSIPVHVELHTWLDSTAAGRRCRKVLYELAEALQRRLTVFEVRPVLREHGWEV